MWHCWSCSRGCPVREEWSRGTPRRCTRSAYRGWRSVDDVQGDEPGNRCAHREAVVQLRPLSRLHWARYAGKNFTDRQRIKRKAQS